ncbi:hypothetical protein BJ546DRAFT_969739 [Cryomyces antarcticus]
MSSISSQPGKTAPRLLLDLVRYDPRRSVRGHNVLTDPPPQFEENRVPPATIAKGSCRHALMIKNTQSLTPPLDSRPDNTTIYKVASFCQDCRCHVDLVVDFQNDPWKAGPCPNEDFPLHHLLHVPQHAQDRMVISEPLIPNSEALEHAFRCSAPSCPAYVTIRLRPPRLRPEHVKLLTDKTLLQARFDAAISADPSREGLRLASPSEALNILRRFILDSLDPKSGRVKFPARNKRFITAFGTDCDELLDGLGFSYIGPENKGGEGAWNLPRPDVSSDPLNTNAHQLLLEDVVEELLVLVWQRTEAEKQGIATLIYQPVPAMRDFERSLGSIGYDQAPSARRNIDLTKEEHPYYASLGAVGDFSDTLLGFAYDRQAECDPINVPYYFEALQDLAQGRQSEILQTKVATLASQGQLSRKDIARAYSYFGFDPNHAGAITDDIIISQFHSRLPDVGPSQAEEMREVLRTLGRSRKSRILEQTASGTIETCSQALAWLGAEEYTEDEFIIAMFTIKVDEDSNNFTVGRQALSIIADARRSEHLHSFLVSGQPPQAPMERKEALCMFGQEEDAKIDLDNLETYYQLYKDDPSVNKDAFERAYACLKNESHARRDSMMNVETSKPPPGESPVGLISNGATCYLNSLLQYYFSIKPLRDLVLDWEAHEAPMTQGTTMREGEVVSADQIRSAQKFTGRLQELFKSMIAEPRNTITPHEDIAFLTFLKHDALVRPANESTAVEHADSTNATHGPEAEPLVDSLNADSNSASQVVVQDNMTLREAAEKAARQQQDVTEAMTSIINQLRYAIETDSDGSEGQQDVAIKNLFYVKLIQLTGRNPPQEQFVTDLKVHLTTEPTSIQTALDEHFDAQTVEYEGHKLTQWLSIKSLPPVLQIHIVRESLKGKIEHHFPLQMELYMDRYMDPVDPGLLELKKQRWQRKKALDVLQKQKDEIFNVASEVGGMNMAENIKGLVEWLKEAREGFGHSEHAIPGITDELLTPLSQEAARLESAIPQLEAEHVRIKQAMDTQFDHLTTIRYRLHAVFFHRGGMRGGHYWICIHDHRRNIWRKYNDDKVSLISQEDVFKEDPVDKGKATPMFLAYVAADKLDELVEPLHREPVEPVDTWAQDAARDEAANQMQWGDGRADEAWAPTETTLREPTNGWEDSRVDDAAAGTW